MDCVYLSFKMRRQNLQQNFALLLLVSSKKMKNSISYLFYSIGAAWTAKECNSPANQEPCSTSSWTFATGPTMPTAMTVSLRIVAREWEALVVIVEIAFDRNRIRLARHLINYVATLRAASQSNLEWTG